jgi:hypothetical protein
MEGGRNWRRGHWNGSEAGAGVPHALPAVQTSAALRTLGLDALSRRKGLKAAKSVAHLRSPKL